jgi:tetratricopeptide (TPR) repeat protein
MRMASTWKWLLLASPLLAATGWAAEDLPLPSLLPLPVNLPAPPTNAPAPFTMDNWESHLPSPVTPTRNGSYHSDNGDTNLLHSTLPALAATVTSSHLPDLPPLNQKPKGTSDDDRLAAIAVVDRDFFLALAKNPQTWPDDERDRHAQAIHDQYYAYIVSYPNDVNAIVLYGKLLNRTGQNDLAYEAFKYADTLDPNLAVVKQQLANHLAETGKYAPALELLRKATALAPTEPVYHYQIGELLNFYYEHFVADKIFDQAGINQTMEAEFARAAALAPEEPAFAWRHAECFYDMAGPDWNAALAAWTDLGLHTTNTTLLEMIRLHRARALLELSRLEEARPLIAQPVLAPLEASRAELARRLALATPSLPTPPAVAKPAS